MRESKTLVGVFFVGGGLVVAAVLHKAFQSLFGVLRMNDAALLGDRVTVSLGLGVLVAAALAVAFYLWPSSSRYLHEVGTELVKVNWPTWSETKVNTLVVVVTSVIAALILGFFDTTFLWISSSLAKGF